MEYQPMTYSVPIMGKTYHLPPRTLDVDARIEEIGGLDAQYQAGKLTRREVLTRMHAFVEELAPGALPPLEKVDVNELTAACLDIMEAYTVELRRARSRMKAEEFREMLQKALAASLPAARK